MANQKLAQQEAAAWMMAAKGLEVSFPGVFARAEELLVRKGQVQLSVNDAHAVADAYMEHCMTPEGRLAVHEAGYTREAYMTHLDRMQMSETVKRITVCCNFRITQQVISFDPTIAACLSSVEDIAANYANTAGEPIPAEMLGRLPFETFILVPNIGPVQSYLVNCVKGMWGNPDQVYLNIIARLQTPDGDVRQVPAATMISPGLSLSETIEETLEMFRKTGVGEVSEIEDHYREITAFVFANALPLLLYLCAENRELYMGSDEGPRIVTTKKGKRLFARQSPNVMPAGMRVGAAIRAYQQPDPHVVVDDSETGTGTTVVPHLRKAHWHTFWTGPRHDVSKRRRILHFLPPIPVNVDALNDLQAVVRPVVLER
jgi:hypothetical protein